ncbi:MAG: monovalent cation/H(+) antiporter subunit G [Firmicutes bacterium]|nr:monovalent cation/H(+) antiporter subunit G [Bacillota bacterium]
MAFLEILGMIFIAGGAFFLLAGVIGFLRLPDVYTRMHAVGKCDTLGSGLIILGLMMIADTYLAIMKLAVVLLLIAVINPVVTHLIAKVSYERGVRMTEGSFILDRYDGSGDERDEKMKTGEGS